MNATHDLETKRAIETQWPTSEAVRKHYAPEDEAAERAAQIIKMLDQLPPGKLTIAQLAPLDHFHAKGMMATKELAELANLKPGMKVLDAGSGIGGPSRYLAATFGCSVIGVDLTPSFVELAKLLTERTGLADRVGFQVGNLLDLPFADAEFEVVWTQHVVMNIEDRAAAYREFRRVLKPGGKLLFHDLFLPDEPLELAYPLPWAATPATSFLYTKSQTIEALEQAGFRSGTWNDDTERTVAAFAGQLQAINEGLGTLTLASLMGPRIAEMGANAARNAQQGRLRAVMGMFERDSLPAGASTRQ